MERRTFRISVFAMSFDRNTGDGARLPGLGNGNLKGAMRANASRKMSWPRKRRGEGRRQYVGMFVKGRPDGKGTYTWENGARLEGTFKNGRADGPAFTLVNGARYEGESQMESCRD